MSDASSRAFSSAPMASGSPDSSEPQTVMVAFEGQEMGVATNGGAAARLSTLKVREARLADLPQTVEIARRAHATRP